MMQFKKEMERISFLFTSRVQTIATMQRRLARTILHSLRQAKGVTSVHQHKAMQKQRFTEISDLRNE